VVKKKMLSIISSAREKSNEKARFVCEKFVRREPCRIRSLMKRNILLK